MPGMHTFDLSFSFITVSLCIGFICVSVVLCLCIFIVFYRKKSISVQPRIANKRLSPGQNVTGSCASPVFIVFPSPQIHPSYNN